MNLFGKKNSGNDTSSQIVAEKTRDSAGSLKRTLSKMGELISNKFAPITKSNMNNTEYLGEIYKMMVEKRATEKLSREKQINRRKEDAYEDTRRHKEIIKALSLRRRPKKRGRKLTDDKQGGFNPITGGPPKTTSTEPPVILPKPQPRPKRNTEADDAAEDALKRQREIERRRKSAPPDPTPPVPKPPVPKPKPDDGPSPTPKSLPKRDNRIDDEVESAAKRQAELKARQEAAKKSAEAAEREALKKRQEADRIKKQSESREADDAAARAAQRQKDLEARNKKPPAEEPRPPPREEPRPAPPERLPRRDRDRPTAERIGDAAIDLLKAPLGFSATMLFEQQIKDEEDALLPWNSRLNAREAATAERQRNIPVNQDYPKQAAATGDVGGSVNYGVFGISNIRTYKEDGSVDGKSSMDRFIKENPDLNLPDPGGPGPKNNSEKKQKENEKVKKFTEAWQKLAKEEPRKLYNAQTKYYEKHYLKPADRSLKDKKWDAAGKPEDDDGVRAYLADRNVVGLPRTESALKYAKDAKTPGEFLKKMAEYDMKNLRLMFDSTPFQEYLSLEKGIKARVIKRLNAALDLDGLPALTTEEIKEFNDISTKLKPGEVRPTKTSLTNDPSQEIAALSTQNNSMRRGFSGAGQNIVNQVTNVISTGDEEIVTASFDDRPAFLRKKIYG